MDEHAVANADRCIAMMDEDGLCITQLWALTMWEFLDTNKPGYELKSYIERKTGMGRRDVSAPAFQARVSTVFSERGIVNLRPELKVEAYRKEELWRLYEEAKWKQPHTPVLLQMKPGLFILVSNAQAAFHLIKDMARDGWYKRQDGRQIKKELLYECQIDWSPARVILDCEGYPPHFDGRMTEEKLLANIRMVPQAFARRLFELDAIPRESVLKLVEKNKCREGKVSAHLISNLIGNTTGSMKELLRKIYIEAYETVRAEWKKTKSMAHVELDKDGFCDPALLVDDCTIKGKHQFSVVFSSKKNEPPCTLEQCFAISNGGNTVEILPSPFKGLQHIPTHPEALSMLFHAGYTHWMPNSIVINRKFGIMSPLVVTPAKKRSGDGTRASASSGASPDRNEFLPSWMKSAIASHNSKAGRGYAENTGMVSLDFVHKTLSAIIPEVQRKHVIHVASGVICPVRALSGSPGYHTNNGVYLATVGDVVYASCPSCVFAKEQAKKRPMVETVAGMEGRKRPWVVYTEEDYKQLIKDADKDILQAAARAKNPTGNKKAKTSSV